METYLKEQLDCLLEKVRPLCRPAMEAGKRHWDGIAKPLEGLGTLEEIIIQIAGIQGSEDVQMSRRAVVVFCSDNGVVAEGVTQTDSSVTAVVTENIGKGIASINRMAAKADVDVLPVDVGVASDIQELSVRNMKIAYGTANLRREPAMSRLQVLEAVHTGIRIAGELKDAGYDMLAVGEMGIGNTTTSSAVASVLLGISPDIVTGKGAGLSPEGLKRKKQVIEEAIALHHPNREEPLEVLAALGGFDLAAMTGLFLGGAIYRIPVVMDGIISAVAALAASRLCPASVSYMIASHRGKEPACEYILKELKLHPVIYANLALGEGTGAVLLFPMLDMAYEVYRENSTFEDIRIEAYHKYDDAEEIL